MTEQESEDDHKIEEEKIMRLFFGEELISVTKDNSLSPQEEHRIFMEVFYGNSVDEATKRNVACHSKKFQSYKGRSKSVASSNHEISVLTSSRKESFGNDSNPTSDYVKELQVSDYFMERSSSWCESNVYNGNMKPMKLPSPEKLNCSGKKQARYSSDCNHEMIDLDQSKISTAVFAHNSSRLGQIPDAPCHIVETCAQGILHSYYLFRGQSQFDDSGDVDDWMPLNNNCKSLDLSSDKIKIEAKSATSPVSQESFSPGVWVSKKNSNLSETPGMLISKIHSEQHSKILNSDEMEIVLKGKLIKDLPDRLRSQANGLLKDAGWKVEPRVRSDRAKLASYFIAPKEKRIITSLSQAWKLCGQRLRANATESEKDNHGREWADINTFWAELFDTLFYIEKQIEMASISLLERWHLLDPFIAVVCINKKISVLREGRVLKAVNSSTFVLSGKDHKGMVDKRMNEFHQSPVRNSCSADMLDENILPAVQLDDKSEVIENSDNQQVPQHHDDQESRGNDNRVKRKISSSTETHKRRLMSLASHLGKVSRDIRSSCHMACKVSIKQHDKDNDLNSKFSFGCTSSEIISESDPYAILTPTSGLEISQTVHLKPDRNVSAHSVPESSLPCDSKNELLIGTNTCTNKQNKQCMKQEKKQGTMFSASQRRFSQCPLKTVCYKLGGNELEQLNYENASDAAGETEKLSEMSPSVYRPDLDTDVMTTNMDNDVISAKMITIHASKSEELSFSAKPNISCKRSRKKSKKISEIGSTNLTNSFDGKYKSYLEFHDNEGTDDPIQLQCIQEEAHISGCNLNCEVMAEKLHETSVAIDSLILKKQNKAVKSGTRAARQHVKSKNVLTSSADNPQTPTTFPVVGTYQAYLQCLTESDSGPKSFYSKKSTTLTKKSSGLLCPKGFSPSKIVHNQHAKSEGPSFVSADADIVTRSGCTVQNAEGFLPSVVLPPPENQTVTKLEKPQAVKKRPLGFRINDDDLLIAAIIKNKDYSSCNQSFSSKVGKKRYRSNGGPKLLLRISGKGGKLSKQGRGVVLGARTVLGWLIERGAISLKDTIQYRNPKNNAIVKDGLVTRNGILCSCCTKIFSISEFKAHCGSKLQKPSSNIFLQSGRSYTLCQLQAWSTEYKTRKDRIKVSEGEELDDNDDTCGFCGDGGELLCCDNCPSTYHQACLPTQDIPEDSWYCHNCVCKLCWKATNSRDASHSLAVFECSQCQHKYHKICVKEKELSLVEVGHDTWFCSRSCKEVFTYLRNRVGFLNCLDDSFSWTILRCNHDDQKVHSAQKIALMAECNTKLAIALTVMEECFLPMVDPRTGIDMIPHVLYNRGSNYTRLNFHGFYTVVLEKGDELVSVASLRVHGVTVAEMPLIATCSEHRRQGMCRRLMDEVEKMLRSFKVSMLVLSAIPSLVDTWTSGFGFRSIGDEEREQLNNVNLMLLPGTVLLIKKIDEAIAEQPEMHSHTHFKEELPLDMDGYDELGSAEVQQIDLYDGKNSLICSVEQKVEPDVDICISMTNGSAYLHSLQSSNGLSNACAKSIHEKDTEVPSEAGEEGIG